MVTKTYLKKIDIEITQLKMIENTTNDLSSLKLNRCSITDEIDAQIDKYVYNDCNKYIRNTS